MKLLYLIPGSLGPGFEQSEIDRREKILQKLASQGTFIHAAASGGGPLSIESECDEANCIPSAITAAIQAEKDGYDGIIIGCAGDPGINAIKEAVSIPVVGPAQTSFALAALVGRKFSVITPVIGTTGVTMDLVAKYGFQHNFASVRSINSNVLSIGQNARETIRKVSAEAAVARDMDGADCIVLGCMSIAFADIDNELPENIGIPVINPVKAALYTLESMVKMNLVQSPKAYPHIKE